MELSPSGGAANSAATQEFPRILWNPKPPFPKNIPSVVFTDPLLGAGIG
jgi:hypothetical protein